MNEEGFSKNKDNNISSERFYSSTPKRSIIKFFLIFLFFIIISLFVIGGYIVYNTYSIKREIRIINNYEFSTLRCFDYCPIDENGTMPNQNCMKKCLEINFNSLPKDKGYEIKDYEKYTLFDEKPVQLCLKQREMEKQKICFKEQVEKYNDYFKDLQFEKINY